MPFIGVRISWLILARNRDFSREAVSACSARMIGSAVACASLILSTAAMRAVTSGRRKKDVVLFAERPVARIMIGADTAGSHEAMVCGMMIGRFNGLPCLHVVIGVATAGRNGLVSRRP